MTRSSWAQARATAFTAATTLPTERVPLDEAVGRVLTAEVRALTDLPHYASSAMDGFAVNGDGPWTIREPADLGKPGNPSSGNSRGTYPAALSHGDAAAIITGGVIPAGTHGILRSENALVSGGILTSSDPDEPRGGQHVRPAGEEAVAGDVVIDAGAVLNPAHVALAAICGHDRLEVVALPRVGFLFTGDEVVEHGMPGPGQVRDSFGPQLPAFVAALGARSVSRARIGDDLDATIHAIGNAAFEVLVTTGGTGSSSADHVRAALDALDAELLVDGVAMRPGGPTMLARRADGGFVVCLPGNPLAAMMGMLTIAQPLVAALGGRAKPYLSSVVAGEDLAGRRGTTLLIPYRLGEQRTAVPSPWRSSGMMRGLASAAGVLVVPEAGARAGEKAISLPLPWLTPAAGGFAAVT